MGAAFCVFCKRGLINCDRICLFGWTVPLIKGCFGWITHVHLTSPQPLHKWIPDGMFNTSEVICSLLFAEFNHQILTSTVCNTPTSDVYTNVICSNPNEKLQLIQYYLQRCTGLKNSIEIFPSTHRNVLKYPCLATSAIITFFRFLSGITVYIIY